jgi:hypothetical protein
VDHKKVTHIDLDQTATGGIQGTTEQRNLDWSETSHEDHIFGTLKSRNRWVADLQGCESGNGGPLHSFLMEGWLKRKLARMARAESIIGSSMRSVVGLRSRFEDLPSLMVSDTRRGRFSLQRGKLSCLSLFLMNGEGSLRLRAVECGLELKHPLVFAVRQCLISDFNHVFLISYYMSFSQWIARRFYTLEIFNLLIN